MSVEIKVSHATINKFSAKSQYMGHRDSILFWILTN